MADFQNIIVETHGRVRVQRQELAAQFVHERVAQGVKRGRTIDADQSDPAVCLDYDVLEVGHLRSPVGGGRLVAIAGYAGNRTCCAPTG